MNCISYFFGLKGEIQNLKLIDYTKKRLDDMYLIMYAIKNDVFLKKIVVIENVDIYTIVGINKKGVRQLVGIYQDMPLKNRYLLDIFESIKSRIILFPFVDDNKSIKRKVISVIHKVYLNLSINDWFYIILQRRCFV